MVRRRRYTDCKRAKGQKPIDLKFPRAAEASNFIQIVSAYRLVLKSHGGISVLALLEFLEMCCSGYIGQGILEQKRLKMQTCRLVCAKHSYLKNALRLKLTNIHCLDCCCEVFSVFSIIFVCIQKS